MAIPNIVPRGNDDGETLGKSTKQWSNVYTKDLTINGSSLTSLIAGKAEASTVSTHTAQLAGTADSALKEQIAKKAPLESPAFTTSATLDGADILSADDVLTLEEIEASTELADTDVASASAIKNAITNAVLVKEVNITIGNISSYALVYVSEYVNNVEGYTPTSITSFHLNNQYLAFECLTVTKNGSVYARVKNRDATNFTNQYITVRVLYVKNGFVNLDYQ